MAKREANSMGWTIFFVALAVLLLAGAYLSFFYYPKCSTQECFVNSMKKCSRSSFESPQTTVTWQYYVKGSSNGFCVVDAIAKKIDVDDEDAKALEGRSMECLIPLQASGDFFPQDKLEYCHGLFKEGIQEILLDRINTYILQNLDQLNMSLSNLSSSA